MGAGLGFGGSLLVQKWTQERAWKREYGLKSIETIYAPLYKDMLRLKNHFENYDQIREIWSESERCNVYSEVWYKIHSSYLFLMILDKSFRARMDTFYEKLPESSQCYQDATRVVYQITEDILKTKNYSTEYNYWDLIHKAIFFDKNFENYMVELSGENGALLKKGIIDYWEKQGIVVPEDFFEQLQLESNKEPPIEDLRKKRKELISKCDYFINELSKRIEEPWKM